MSARLLGFAVLLANPVSAATASAQEAAPADCELHVWPSGPLNSVYSGWFHGGIVNGAVTGRDGYPAVPADPLGAQSQIALLTSAQPQAMIGRSAYRLVPHDAPLSSREIRTSTGRLSAAATPCYAELIVDDVFLQQDVFHGSFLKSSFRFRDFGNAAAATPTRVFGTWVKTELNLFPPKEASKLEPASEELKGAYKQNLSLFAAALQKPVKAKRKN